MVFENIGDGRRQESRTTGEGASLGETLAANDPFLWSAFSSVSNANVFCQNWLAVQCGLLKGVTAGLLLVGDSEGHYSTAAVWPDPKRDVTYLAGAAEAALKQRRGIIHRPADQSNRNTQIGLPIEVDRHLRGAVVVDISTQQPRELQDTLHKLQWGAGWMEALFRRQHADEDATRLARMNFALDVLADATDHESLQATAFAVANYLATKLDCRSVSIGLHYRSGIQLLAISHTAVFQQKAHVIGATINAMEEAFDQNASVAVPPTPQTERQISLAHRDFAKAVSATSALSVIMKSSGRAVGVIALDRNTADAFDAKTIELIEAVAVLVGPMFAMKADADRLVSGRLLRKAGFALQRLVGPRHPSVKLAVGFAASLLVVLSFAQGEFRITAKSAVEGAIQRAAVAPFDGYIATAPVRAGDIVEKGQVLATFDERDLRLESARWKGEYEQQVLKYNDALAKHDRPAAGVLFAAIDQTRAQLELAEDKLKRAKITAPFRGVIVSGDLRQLIGSPIEKGKVLFEIAPLDAFRVILQVDERDIAYVAEGQTGKLVLTGFSATSLPFTTKSVTPVATASEGRNYFRVEADVYAGDLHVRPGMEGIAKIFIDERRLLGIWTRTFIDWIRISAWKWLP